MLETILARAPSSTVTVGDGNLRAKPDKKKVAARFKQLFVARENFVKRWKQIRDHQLPYLGEFDDTQDLIDPARRRDLDIYNGEAWESCQVFAAGIMSGLTPPSRQWFRFSFSNKALADNAQAGAILDERMEILMDVLSKSNFYNSIHNVYMELPFGQCPLGIFTSGKSGVMFVQFPIGTYALDVGADGRVNTFARKFQMTAAQLAEQFGTDNLPQGAQEAIQNGNQYTTKFTVCWLVEPNENANQEKAGKANMSHKSLYWIDGNQAEEWLYVGGFEEFPVPVARYQVTGLQAYAKGPGWYAEGDSKILSVYEKDSLILTELLAKPALQGPASALDRGVNLYPGGYTPTEGDASITPLFKVEGRVDILDLRIDRTEQRIKRIYSADLFLLLDQLDKGQMTAEEVIKRSQEKLQQLGPVVERLQFEFLSPAIERVYNILERAGIFPPIPEEINELLQRESVKIEYISPLAQAQKMNGLVNIEQAIAFVGNLVQLYPEAREKINPLEAVDCYLEKLGSPATIKKSNEEVQKILQERQEQAEAEKQMQQTAMMAESIAPAAQAAKNLTEAARDGNPALQEMMGMGAGNV